ncbi:HesA/MoeB/ThiF family protein [Streptomyces sp. NPDC056835]|uniref:HesA/MoeB/ThiF family protein n=1 Tax=Streptomyces sp. NPDC056835 TaxID=3345956 RepID=UPI003699EB0A
MKPDRPPPPVSGLRRPRVKPEHRAYRTVDGNVRIGSVVYGIGAEVADPDGWIWTLTEALDGTRGRAESVDAVLARHPGVERGAVFQAIAELYEAGFLEDAEAEPPDTLTDEDRVRYSRGVTLLRWMDLSPHATAWELQARLRSARVLLLGLGGTGGFAAQGLVASGVGRMHCVDGDVVELSNLNRQPLYHESDIGRSKATAADAALRAVNSRVALSTEHRAVRGPDDIAALLAPGYDLLLLCADRPPEIRRWANRVCLAAGVPWLDAGYRGPLVTVGVHAPGRGACWECHRAGEVDRRDLRLAAGQDEEAASPRMEWNPVNAVTAGLSGHLLVHAAIALLTGVPEMEPGFRFGLNLMALSEPVEERYERRPDCPACGTPRAVRRPA